MLRTNDCANMGMQSRAPHRVCDGELLRNMVRTNRRVGFLATEALAGPGLAVAGLEH
jgi:hypothetical protein